MVEYSNRYLNGDRVQVERYFLFVKNIFNFLYNTDIHTYDLGQNMAGTCRIRFNGTFGFGIYVRFGEILTKPDIASK